MQTYWVGVGWKYVFVYNTNQETEIWGGSSLLGLIRRVPSPGYDK